MNIHAASLRSAAACTTAAENKSNLITGLEVSRGNQQDAAAVIQLGFRNKSAAPSHSHANNSRARRKHMEMTRNPSCTQHPRRDNNRLGRKLLYADFPVVSTSRGRQRAPQ